MSKAKVMFPSDTISLKDVYTGGNSAGNGGDGVNTGDISSKPSIEFNPYNKAEGADVHVNTGDQVHQKAYWDAGGANAKAEKYSKAEGGKAVSGPHGGEETRQAQGRAKGAQRPSAETRANARGTGSDRCRCSRRGRAA